MYNEFMITEPGMQLNGKVLMPGTRLLHKGEPHPSWKNVGHATGAVVERKLVVASPYSEGLSELPALSNTDELLRGERIIPINHEQPVAQEVEQPAQNEQPSAQKRKQQKGNR